MLKGEVECVDPEQDDSVMGPPPKENLLSFNSAANGKPDRSVECLKVPWNEMNLILLEMDTRRKFQILDLKGAEEVRKLKKKLKVEKKVKAAVSKKKQTEMKVASFLNLNYKPTDEIQEETIT